MILRKDSHVIDIGWLYLKYCLFCASLVPKNINVACCWLQTCWRSKFSMRLFLLNDILQSIVMMHRKNDSSFKKWDELKSDEKRFQAKTFCSLQFDSILYYSNLFNLIQCCSILFYSILIYSMKFCYEVFLLAEIAPSGPCALLDVT